MSRDEHKAEFEEFVLVSWRRLGKTAYALGDMTVQVSKGQDAPDMSEAFWSVSVYPTDPSRGGIVQINAFVKATSWEEAEAQLPSVEMLTELALDERLAPPTE